MVSATDFSVLRPSNLDSERMRSHDAVVVQNFRDPNLVSMVLRFILRGSAVVCERCVTSQNQETILSPLRQERDLQQSLASSSTDVEPHGKIVSKTRQLCWSLDPFT